MTQPQKLAPSGFIWGNIYIAINLIVGAVGTLLGVVALFQLEDIDRPRLLGALWVIMGISFFHLLSGIGVWGRWRWGLNLAYALLGLFWLWALVSFANFLLFSQGWKLSGWYLASRILLIIGMTVMSTLWVIYFYRRRRLFT